MTFEQEISEILKPMQPRKGSGVKFSEVVASIKEAVERHVPAEANMKAAHVSHSDAGAGYVIGHNACRTQMLETIPNKEGK